MTPREKAVATIGHLDEDCGVLLNALDGDCTCDFSLHVLIAAERGRLFRECQPDRDADLEKCRRCGKRWNYGTRPPGPCAEPLTPALAWELWTELAPIAEFDRSPSGRWQGISFAQPTVEVWEETPEEAVARLYLALAEAGLLPKAVDPYRAQRQLERMLPGLRRDDAEAGRKP